MKRKQLYGMVVATALSATLGAVGCGDNSETCGTGTVDIGGVCTAGSGGSASCGPGTKANATGQCVPDGSVVCTGETMFDPTTGTCVVSSSACKDGTVLVMGQCVDQGRVPVDVEEATEPNGLNILGEDSNGVPAGSFTLKAIGGGAVVLHGTITPFRDANMDGLTDADSDAFVVHVDAPAAIKISVDGVGGTMGGFLGVAVNVTDPASPLGTYERFGINVTGDTAVREMVFPAPGDYAIAISDSRSLFLGGAYGSATSEYYASIEQIAIPAPTSTITLTNGSGSVTDTLSSNEIKAYSVAVTNGFNDILAPSGLSTSVNPALDILNNGAYRTNAEPTTDIFGQPVPPEALLAGFTSATTLTVIYDPQFNFSFDPAAIEIDVTESTATALSTSGGTVTQTETANANPLNGQSITTMNTFFYDVVTDGDTLGMTLKFTPGVEAVVVDSSLNVVSFFTALDGAETVTDFSGLVRHLTAGRYYFLVDDPAGTAGTTSLSVKSTIALQAAAALTTGTASASSTNGTFDGALFTYTVDKVGHPWIDFEGTPSGGGNLTIAGYDTATAFGRLTAVDTSNGPGAEPPDAKSVFSRTGITNTPGGGHIDLDDTATTYLLDVSSSTAGAFTFSILDRVFSDLGTASATAVTKTAQTLAANGDFYLIHATVGDIVKFTITPTGAPKPHLQLLSLDADEGTLAAVSTGLASTGAINGSFVAASDWVAIEVAPLTGLDTGTFDLSAVTVPAVTAYTKSTPAATTLTSICNPANTVDTGGNLDSGLSAAIPLNSPFTFFGATVGAIQISTNGWLSFQTNQKSGADFNVALPNTANPNALVAVYWDDLDQVEVCETEAANTVTVEWNGVLFADGTTVVHVQAKLNTATGVLQFIYGADQQALGDTAVIGVEDFTGTHATQVEANTAGSITAGTSFTLTPQ